MGHDINRQACGEKRNASRSQVFGRVKDGPTYCQSNRQEQVRCKKERYSVWNESQYFVLHHELSSENPSDQRQWKIDREAVCGLDSIFEKTSAVLDLVPLTIGMEAVQFVKTSRT